MPLRSLPCVNSTVATQDLCVFWFQGLALIKVTVSNRQCRLTSQLRQFVKLRREFRGQAGELDNAWPPHASVVDHAKTAEAI